MAYLLESDQLTKYYGDQLLFSNVSLRLREGEKAGLVGPNGAGKTTLLSCLSGRDRAYEGNVRLASYASIGFLAQTQFDLEEETLLSSVMEVFSDLFAQRKRIEELEQNMGALDSRALEQILQKYGAERDSYERAGGFSAETQVRRVLSGLGFQEDQLQRTVASFSGGEKTRIGLARILVREYPLLFLDEPTNHLDLDSLEWLEAFLKDYPGALLVVSHDRYFLDGITETIFDLEGGRLKRYKGNYSVYAAQKEEDRKAQLRAFEKQQKEIKETEAYIARYKAGIKAKQARGRQSRLNRLERKEKPEQSRVMHMGKAEISGQAGDKVLVLEQISFGYGDEQLFSNLEATIRLQERVALLGPNGAGKTTILKLIMGLLKPQNGGVFIGPSAKPVYFDQEYRNLTAHHSVLEEILHSSDLTVEEAKSHLARFLFFAEDWDKQIANLSGGERGRISLLKMTLHKGNVLLLDEPTNHLDIRSREIMEEYLLTYPGTLLMVSHDRYFIDTLAERVLELTPSALLSYQGNYTDYRERKERMKIQERKTAVHALTKRSAETGVPKADRYVRARLRQKLQELEKEISDLEEREAELVEALSKPDTYSQDDANDVVKELNEQLRTIQSRLPEAYLEWEETGRNLETSAASTS
ncbi:MAG: ABC-F family ATP-binding cassette domain-containing protein [Clostridiales bacterium]|nr:ABC-F family ATP-binding cassette domain-containing protein [Clostridiales bacterium]